MTPRKEPPKWADRLLKFFCHPELLEEIQGDLYEIFHHRQHTKSLRHANAYYCYLVFRSFRLSTIRKPTFNKTGPLMFRSNMKIALRVIRKFKVNTIMNLAGLTVGLTAVLLIGLFLRQELTFDSFHEKTDRIYRMWVKEDYGGGRVFFNTTTPLIFESVVEENYPEVERVVHYSQLNAMVGESDDLKAETVGLVSPDFHEVFDVEIRESSGSGLFENTSSLVLSTSAAVKYFGSDPALNRTLPLTILGEQRLFTVSAIVDDFPPNTGLGFDMAISADNAEQLFGENAMTAWFLVIGETYVLLKEGADISQMADGIDELMMSYLGDRVEEGQYRVGFQPLSDIHLNPEYPVGYVPVSNPQYIYILAFTAILILVLAALNYTNVAVGQSLIRGREVAMRKVMGAGQNNLLFQHLMESGIISFLSVGIALLIALALLPVFNQLVGADLHFEFNLPNIGYILLLILVLGALSGIYPGLVFSRFNIIKTLKGQATGFGKFTTRKVILAFQIFVATGMIIATLITRDQLNYIRNHDLGYTYESSVWLPMRPARTEEGGPLNMVVETMRRSQALKEKIKAYPQIEEAGLGTHVPGTPGWLQVSYNDPSDNFKQFTILAAEADYLTAFDMTVIKGRSFDRESESDKRRALLMNEAAVDLFGFEEPLGKQLPGNDFGDHEIIGVIEDFNFSSLHEQVGPLVIVQDLRPIMAGIADVGGTDPIVPKMVVKFSSSNPSEIVDILEKEWEAMYPEVEFRFTFMDQHIASLYESERKLNRILATSAIIAVIISILGVLGLTILIVRNNLRQIGIRKIVGARPVNIFFWLLKGFGWPYFIAIALAVPAVYWGMGTWLQNFAYRTNPEPLSFLTGILLVAVIGIIVISWHALRASWIKPVHTLRME